MSNAAFHVTYSHVVLEGTAAECGRAMGRHILARGEGARAQFAAPKPGCADPGREELDAFFRLNDRYCPGINDEMQGLADALGIGVARLAANLLWHSRAGCCSHLAALPAATENGHLLVARSYEWNAEDELRLVTTRVKGKFAHTGFSVFACGRLEGMNEKGLCITMSAGAPGKAAAAGGFLFWAGIRAALDTCSDAAEAEALLCSMPSCFYDNLILSDRRGHATLIENACGHRAVKRIGPGGPERWLWSTNHFTLPGMAEHGNVPMWMSAARYERIGRALASAAPAVGKEALRALLSATVPEGLCCHFYREWFGTLWSMLIDVTEGSMEVCFGPPTANSWRTFGLDGPAGATDYPVVLPDETNADPRFFAREW